MSFLLDTDTCSVHLKRPSGLVHLMMAGVALVHNLTLVTHKTADYQHVPGLRLNDWLTP